MNINTSTLHLTHLESGVLIVKFNRPDKLNALNQTVCEELSNVLCESVTNTQISGLLFTGEGKAFCAGADINELSNTNSVSGHHFAERGQTLFRQIETLSKPVIAAINGYTFGGGCELAMACHVRIASSNALFGQPEIKLGVIPGYGGTQRLARLVGKGRALDLCLSGRTIDANTAERWGLITEITTPETLIDVATARLTDLINLAPLAYKSTLDVIDRGFDLPLDDAMQLERMHFSYLCGTHDKQEGTQAFLEKRRAEFTGS